MGRYLPASVSPRGDDRCGMWTGSPTFPVRDIRPLTDIADGFQLRSGMTAHDPERLREAARIREAGARLTVTMTRPARHRPCRAPAAQPFGIMAFRCAGHGHHGP